MATETITPFISRLSIAAEKAMNNARRWGPLGRELKEAFEATTPVVEGRPMSPMTSAFLSDYRAMQTINRESVIKLMARRGDRIADQVVTNIKNEMALASKPAIPDGWSILAGKNLPGNLADAYEAARIRSTQIHLIK